MRSTAGARRLSGKRMFAQIIRIAVRILLVVVATLAAVGCSSTLVKSTAMTETAAEPTAEPVKIVTIVRDGPTASPQSTNTIETQDGGTPAAPQKVGDILVEVTHTKVIPTGVEIGVCYTTPDSGDWYPVFEHLFFGSQEIYPDEFEFLSEERADGNQYGKRCVAVRYKIDDTGSITTPLRFGVEEIFAIPREGNACDNIQARLETSPKARAYGLKVKCEEFDNGTQFSVELMEHDAAVDRAAAQQALDAIVQGSMTGPWTFVVTEIER